MATIFLFSILAIVVIWFFCCFIVVDEGERAVVLTFGSYSRTLDPGLNLIFRPIQRATKVDIRSTPVDVEGQQIITKDNVSVEINAIVYYKITEAKPALLSTSNYEMATVELARTTLCDMACKMTLDELLRNRATIATNIQTDVSSATKNWGVQIEMVKIQEIELSEDMKRAMAKEAEAEREKTAAKIRAEGEKVAADAIADAATKLATVPNGLEIRTLQTIERIAKEPSQKIILSLPSNLSGIVSNLTKTSP